MPSYLRARDWGSWALLFGVVLSGVAAWLTAGLERAWNVERIDREGDQQAHAFLACLARGRLALDLLTAFHVGSERVEPAEFEQFAAHIVGADFGARWVSWSLPSDEVEQVLAFPSSFVDASRQAARQLRDPRGGATLMAFDGESCLVLHERLPHTAAGKDRGDTRVALALPRAHSVAEQASETAAIELAVRATDADGPFHLLRSSKTRAVGLPAEPPPEPGVPGVRLLHRMGTLAFEVVAYRHSGLPSPGLLWSWIVFGVGAVRAGVVGGALGFQQGPRRRVERLVDLRTHQLAEMNAQLENRVAGRTRELSDTAAELETFNYSVSHDLRAPLRAIAGFADMLAEDHDRELGDEAKRKLGVIRGSALRASSLVEALLRLSRLGRQALAPAEVDLDALVDGIVTEQRAAGAPHRFHHERLGGLRADPVLLGEVLRNLIGNAVKFSRQAAAPEVEVSRRDVGDHVELAVRDNGVGFDPARAADLFVPFQRLHRADQFDGHGIGLATCQRIVHRHGGDIRAESEAGRGATFTVRIPHQLPSPS